MDPVVEVPVVDAPSQVVDDSAKTFLKFVAQREGRAPDEGKEDKPAATPESEAAAKPAEKKKSAGSDPDEEEQDEEDAAEGADLAQTKSKRRGGFQRRIERKDARIRDLEAQLAAKAAETKPPEAPKPSDTPAAKPADKKSDSKPKPRLENFDSIEEFTEALTDWKLERRDEVARESADQQKAQREQAERVGKWNERAQKVREANPDYDAVLESVNDIRISDDLQRAILDDERGPELAYMLAQNPEELERIAKLPVIAGVKALGKISARLEENAPEEPARRAPKPPTRVGRGSATAVPDLGDPKLDFKSFVKLRERAA